MKIPFNKPYLSGKEIEYITDAAACGKLSGNGKYTNACQHFLEEHYGFNKILLTTSGTDALEMAAILSGVGPGDEVIVPSYTFVSSALAFIRQGADVVFADSDAREPDIDAGKIEALITKRTKAIVPVHYAGVACDMDKITDIADRHGLLIIEDAAQAIDSYHTGKNGRRALGSIGHLGCFSFHETKNIISGEGGCLAINDPRFLRRAEIIWEKGTNRAEFFRGEVNKYGWVDTGSSFLPSEINAAFLHAQLESLNNIQARRLAIWERYHTNLKGHENGAFQLPYIPPYATNNAHMFYLVCRSLEFRSRLIAALKEAGIMAVFHYLSLHASEYYSARHDGRILSNADRYTDCLVRMPMFYELSMEHVDEICDIVKKVASCEN